MVNKITVVGAGNVGATTAQRIAEAGLAGGSSRGLRQHVVADLVPVRVVDVLEAVEVDEQHGDPLLRAARPLDGVPPLMPLPTSRITSAGGAA